MGITNSDFVYFRDYLHGKTGLALNEDKVYLLESRLDPVLRKWGYSEYSSLAVALKGVAQQEMVQDVIDAMMTNETMFFRDDKPFVYFREKILPVLKAARPDKKLRIWSAACSTGQEPYSIAMMLRENLSADWDVQITATDISDVALARARTGIYNAFEAQRGLPPEKLERYFRKEERGWAVRDELRAMVRFQSFNLLDSMAALPSFDVIFCRNVLMYFGDDTRRQIIGNMAGKLAADGYLFLGSTERIGGDHPAWRGVPDCSGLYTLSSGAAGG